MKYQTKLHEGLVPRQLHDVGKVVQVRNEEVFVYDSKLKNFCLRAIYLYINPSFIVQKFLITSSCSLI